MLGRKQAEPQPYDTQERSPLLHPGHEPYPRRISRSPSSYNSRRGERAQTSDDGERRKHIKRRAAAACCLAMLFAIALAIVLGVWDDGLPNDPREAAKELLSRAPVIDGHIDLPILVRELYRNNVTAINLRERMPGHVDIPRLREGHVGGFFWSVYVDCKPENENFTHPSYRVRDTLEQIDVARLLMENYTDTFQFATSAADVRDAIHNRKIASLIGVEGAHQLGNSIGVLRQYYALGARYMTLTHACNNAFADSGGMVTAPRPAHHGLSKLGEALVYEMNRLGMLVDLSHVSDDTAKQALALSASRGAPVFWSHSSSRYFRDISRNVPDEIIDKLTTVEDGMTRWRGQTDGVVMVNFAPHFISNDDHATLEEVADHVEHIARVAGKEHVGIGSDYDGIGSVPVGLEDVSKYPDLVAELYARGWNRQELAGFTGGNVLRVLERAEKVARTLQGEGAKPAMDVYDKREDL